MWLLGAAAFGFLFPALAAAGITGVSLSVSPTSIARGASATATLTVTDNGSRLPARIEVELGGDAVLGEDFEYAELAGPEMESTLSDNTVIVDVSPGGGEQSGSNVISGSASISAIGFGPSKTLNLTVVRCVEGFPEEFVECPTGASAQLTIEAREEPPAAEDTDTGDTGTEDSVGPLEDLPGLNTNERIIGATITDVCDGLAGLSNRSGPEQDLFEQCSALLDATDPGAAAQGVIALTPKQAVAPRKLTDRLAGAQLDNIASRLAALRGGARGFSIQGLTMTIDGQYLSGGSLAAMLGDGEMRGGAAGADDYQFERLGIFVNGNVDWGNKDGTGNEDGFDFDSVGITAGIDYRFIEGLVVGFALGYGNSDVTIDSNGGDLDATAWNATLYTTYYPTESFYLEGSASYGWGSYDQTRNISYGLLGSARAAKADFDGNQYALMVGAGYDLTQGPNIIDLYGRLNYVDADVDGYRERGAQGLDLVIQDQSSTSLRSVLGAQFTRAISVPKAVLLPQGWLEWSHEFEDGDDDVSGFFASDPNRIAFALTTDRFDSDFFRLGLGLGAQFGQGRTAFVSYEAAIGLNDYEEHSVNAGVRLDF
jgi:outer membrane autotransporter protein